MFYEERAQGLLCGTDQVRTDDVTDFHDADRISDHETNLADFHPSFWSFDDLSDVEDPLAVDPDSEEPDDEPTNAWVALETAVEFFVDSGWSRPAAQMALECIAARLIRTGNKRSTFESLRRDPSIRCHLDIDQDSWIAVLHAVLGHDQPNLEHTAAGRGILKRLLTGERYDETVPPHWHRRRHRERSPRRNGAGHMPDSRGRVELQRSIESIQVGARHRRDPGDLRATDGVPRTVRPPAADHDHHRTAS